MDRVVRAKVKEKPRRHRRKREIDGSHSTDRVTQTRARNDYSITV